MPEDPVPLPPAELGPFGPGTGVGGEEGPSDASRVGLFIRDDVRAAIGGRCVCGDRKMGDVLGDTGEMGEVVVLGIPVPVKDRSMGPTSAVNVE